MSRAGVGLAHLLTYYRDLCLHRLPIGAVKHPPVKAHRISRFDHGAHRGKVVVEELVQDVGAGPFVLVGFDSQEKAAWKTATQWPVGRSANAEIKSKPKRSMCFIFLSLSLSLSLVIYMYTQVPSSSSYPCVYNPSPAALRTVGTMLLHW